MCVYVCFFVVVVFFNDFFLIWGNSQTSEIVTSLTAVLCSVYCHAKRCISSLRGTYLHSDTENQTSAIPVFDWTNLTALLHLDLK